MDSLPNDIHRLSLYFFLMLPDDETARNAAKESYREVKRQATESGSSASDASFVALVHTTWLRFKRKFAKLKEPVLTGTGWVVREPWDIDTWLQFRRTAREEEVEAVVFGQIFGLSDAEVARGLELSEGTIRARRLRGVVKLSGIVHQRKLRANA